MDSLLEWKHFSICDYGFFFSLKLSYNQFFKTSMMNKYPEADVEFKMNIFVILPSMPRYQFNLIGKTILRVGR